jgi:hypothetical protein
MIDEKADEKQIAAAVVVGAILWANRCTGGDC